uniref:ZP domain-containing protein n=1 Tax=Glossina palpalis gambiensis TaxID=67801 RepID=A0A1B0AXC6_9MUSC
MRVEIGLPEINEHETSNSSTNTASNNQNFTEEPQIYLEGLKGYPDERCHPEINASLAIFRLSLSDFYECGVTRMVNQLTGKKVYYHKIIIESQNGKEIVKITTSLTERAPEPRLAIGVSQNGKRVTGDLTVTPGTPLTMEINLDRDSAPVYGLGVNYLEVTDTRLLSETIIFKGCTVDPYLFENFNTIDGDTLSAKFKAFKFPDSSYVQFRATVNVCLDKCLGTQCSNGQIGYGRRKRDVSDTKLTPLMDTNKVYEISLAMFIKVNDVEGVNRNEVLRLEEKLRELKLANQRLARNSRGNFAEPLLKTTAEEPQLPSAVPAFVVDEKELEDASSGSLSNANNLLSMVILILFIFLMLCINMYIKKKKKKKKKSKNNINLFFLN